MTPPDPETDREAVAEALYLELDTSDEPCCWSLVSLPRKALYQVAASIVLKTLAQRGRLVGEWIACSDKQPPNTGDQVLVASPGALGWLVTTDEWDADRCEACVISGVTNWMPLPPPPRVPGEGDGA